MSSPRFSIRRLVVLGLALLALVVAGSAYFFYADTSPQAMGPTAVADHRDFPTREATVTNIANGLDAPWAFDWLPNGDVLVTERFGSVRVIRDGVLLEDAVAGAPEVFAAGQGGLLDVAVHPAFARNQLVYLSYAHGTEEGNRLRILRATFREMRLEDPEVIFEVAQTKNGGGHFGSRFLWLPDGTLLFSVGDGGNPPIEYNGAPIREQSQLLTSHLGKMIRLNDDGSIPSDNPFAGRPDVRQEIFSYGHRNVQGVAHDAARDRIIVSEHGSKGGDELNLVVAGQNYGWPLTTYSTEYDISGTPISAVQSLADMEDPAAVWTPSIAPSDVLVYTGGQYADWSENVFLAAMVLRADNSISAYTTSPAGAVLRLEMDDAGAIAVQERLTLGDVRVRSIEQGPDGFIYVLTDGTAPQNRPGANGGALWRLDG